MSEPEKLLSARELAELLGVHENWVYDRAASGEIPSFKLEAGRGGTRRFRWSEVEQWLNDRRDGRRVVALADRRR